ncbi:DUF4440 domain-containing protein [Bacteriovoracaceae bacterium]|nr:DUF4440 domain-containing protein [Bacteriovoracaceae bacterium]
MDEKLINKIIQLEKELHSEETRSNQERLDKLIHPGFKEIGLSGSYYTKENILQRLPDTIPVEINSYAYEAIELNASLVQLIYKTNISQQNHFRSSIWILENEEWKMIFHQGTPLEDN